MALKRPWQRFFYSSTYFTKGRMDLHREAIGPDGSNCFWRGVRTKMSKETYSHLWFSSGVSEPPVPLFWIRLCSEPDPKSLSIPLEIIIYTIW